MKRTFHVLILVGLPVAAFSVVVSQRFVTKLSLAGTSHSAFRTSSLNSPDFARTDVVAVGAMSSPARLVESYGKLPLSFEVNQGQADAQVKFLSRGRGYALFLAADEAVLSLRGSRKGVGADLVLHRKAFPEFTHFFEAQQELGANTLTQKQNRIHESQATAVVRMKLSGANHKAKVVGLEELPGKSNYFIGNEPKRWRTNVATYAKVKYSEVYPGIDLVYYGNQGELEYDFLVAPGADPNAIDLTVGADSAHHWSATTSPPRIAADGDLVVQTEDGEVHFQRPLVYQRVASGDRDGNSEFTAGEAKLLDGHYVLTANNHVRFEVPSYDKSQPLVIDPVLSYSTYLGGSGGDDGTSIAVDSSGNAYVTGNTTSPDFPTMNPIQGTNHGGVGDVFVAKLNPEGTALVYSTYLGGSSGDFGEAIAVDSSGNAYITGTTASTDFPTKNPIQAANGSVNGNAFVTKLNAAGSALVYSTYLGGTGGSNDVGFGIAVDSSGNTYVTGVAGTTDFPTMNPIQGANAGPPDAFVAKLNATGNALVYSTYLGGSAEDDGRGIAVDSSGNAYVAGNTSSADFPIANSSPFNPGGCTGGGFVTKINAGGTTLTYSTYLGCGGNNGIAVDPSGNAYVAGFTFATDFPTVNPIQPASAGFSDAIVAKLNAAGSALVYSTYLGGSGNDQANGIAVDSSGNAYITGITGSSDFPTTNPLQVARRGSGGDVFVTKVNAAGTALAYSTYLGGSIVQQGNGIAVDSSGDAYVTGFTNSADFSTLAPFQAACGSGTLSPGLCHTATSFISKISPANASAASFAPAAVVFFGQLVNTASTAQTVAVSLLDVGSAALNINNISITGANSGDFALAGNTCGASLAGGTNCAVNVTFTPTASGSRTATLTATDNAPNSPQTVPLSGTGEDFGIAVAPGSSSSTTVTAGQSATYTISVSPLGGFNQVVNLNCSGGPTGGTCTPLPSSLTLDGTNSQNVTVTVTTPPRALLPSDLRPRDWPWNPMELLLLLCAVALTIVLSLMGTRRLRSQTAFALLILCVISLASLAACGGGSSGPPPQNFTLTVTGTSGSLSHKTTLTLTVN